MQTCQNGKTNRELIGEKHEKTDDASIFIGQVKHLEFDLIRNQSQEAYQGW